MNPATGAPAVLRVGEDGEGLGACVHCGLYLPACPTFEALREENDSPRGRIYLMRLLVEGRIPALGAFSRHIDRCLGCRACEAACPAGVRFGTLLERAREDRRRWAGSTPLASLMLWGLSGGRASRVAYALLRFLRRTGMAAAGASLPGRMGVALAMLAATAPGARLPRRAGTQSSGKLEVYALLEECHGRAVPGGSHGHETRSLGVRIRGASRSWPGLLRCAARALRISARAPGSWRDATSRRASAPAPRGWS
ncbi:MAG: 4Fe-4S dicluster domain-containing protein [Gemmatimonadetes bacterium]|nr:4Fe-4S dicluster domain-containing protein [Gemmatimonadota bacterium]